MEADWAECYSKHADGLLRFAASQVGATDAADVVSDAVIGILRRDPDDVREPSSYLYGAVANAAAKHWRSLDRRRRRERWLAVPSSTEDAAPESSGSEAMVRALATLSVQQRAVVHLTYWEDLTPSVVAARLGVTDGTVRRQLARARARLRKGLGEHDRG